MTRLVSSCNWSPSLESLSSEAVLKMIELLMPYIRQILLSKGCLGKSNICILKSAFSTSSANSLTNVCYVHVHKKQQLLTTQPVAQWEFTKVLVVFKVIKN